MPEGILGTSREKYWSELDDASKIERLREYAQRVDRLTERIGDLEDQLKNHKHLDGELVVPMRRLNMEKGYSRQGCYGCKTCKDQVRI